MANIEPGLPCAIIGEGAAVRLGAEAGQDASETHVYFEPCEENKAVTVAESQHNDRTGSSRRPARRYPAPDTLRPAGGPAH